MLNATFCIHAGIVYVPACSFWRQNTIKQQGQLAVLVDIQKYVDCFGTVYPLLV